MIFRIIVVNDNIKNNNNGINTTVVTVTAINNKRD